MTSPEIVAKKLARVADEIVRERGEMSLFALVLPEDFGRWELVVAAPWADEERFEAIDYVARKLKKRLSPKDRMLISRIAPIEQNHPLCEALRRADAVGMTSCVIHAGDVVIRGAHVISPKTAA